MQGLPLGGELQDQALGLLLGDNLVREVQANLALVLELLVAPPLRQRRHRLEAPFLKRNLAKRLVSVVDDFALPSRLLLLPVGPCLGGPGGALVDVACLAFGCGDAQALGVEEGAPRRHGQQVESHVVRGGGRNVIILWCIFVSSK